MGNGPNSLFKKPAVQIPGAILILTALVFIVAMFTGGNIDCGDPATDLIVFLDTYEEYGDTGTQAAVCIVDGKGKYEIDSEDAERIILPEEERSDTRQTISNNIAYFVVRENGEIVTDFPMGMEVSVFYTAEALQRISDGGNLTPHIAFLEFKNGARSGGWVELGGSFNQFVPDYVPGEVFEKVIIFKIWRLPDPLIGGA